MTARVGTGHAIGLLALLSIIMGGCPGSEQPVSSESGSMMSSGDGASGDSASGDGASGDSASGDGPGDSGTPIECESGEPLVSGTVVREMTETTWNEPFEPTAEAHVVMSLNDFIIDGPTVIVVEHDVPFEMLPFDYVICGNPETAFSGEGVQVVSIDIYNHEGIDSRVGDLVSEYQNEVDGVTEGLEILVSGLEHCDSPNAGGFCTSNEG